MAEHVRTCSLCGGSMYRSWERDILVCGTCCEGGTSDVLHTLDEHVAEIGRLRARVAQLETAANTTPDEALATARARCARFEGRLNLALLVVQGDRDSDPLVQRALGRQAPPPLVHVLIGGHAACGAGAPQTWQADAPDARWVRESETDDATCELCRAAVERLRDERTGSGREKR